MGTNYYHHLPTDDSILHIGKSSAGWVFLVHIHPELGINTLGDWIQRFRSAGHIEDEYNARIEPEDMIQVITNRRNLPHLFNKHRLDRNHASPGPKFLFRPNIMHGHCVGHGNGTYSYMVSDFS